MLHCLPPIIATPRLRLRAPRAIDAELIFDRYAQDPAVSRYVQWQPHEEPEDTRAFVAKAIGDWRAGTRRAYVLELKAESGAPAGMLDARPKDDILEIGYVLARDCWGRGLMPEAVLALTDAALVPGGFSRVYASCDRDNQASIRTLEKAGFVRERRLANAYLFALAAD